MLDLKGVLTLALSIVFVPPVQADSAPADFWHAGLVVADLDVMDAFYTRVIGLNRVTDLRIEDETAPHRWDDAMRVTSLDVLLAITGTQVEVRHYQGPGAPMAFELLRYHNAPAGSVERTATSPLGLTHVGFTVDSLDRVIEASRREQLGTVVSSPQALPDFGGRFVFLRDPEGNFVELMEAVEPTAEGQ